MAGELRMKLMAQLKKMASCVFDSVRIVLEVTGNTTARYLHHTLVRKSEGPLKNYLIPPRTIDICPIFLPTQIREHFLIYFVICYQ